MKKSIIIFMALATVLLTACVMGNGSRSKGKAVTKTYKAKPFNYISLDGNFDVHYTQGNRTSVKVKADTKAIKDFRIEVKDSMLTLSTKKDSWTLFGSGHSTIEVYIVSPDLTGVATAGACRFTAPRHIDTDNMEINIAGSGDVDISSLICDSVSVSIAGSGDMELGQLTTGYSGISIAGSGSVSVKSGSIGNAESEIAGSGAIELIGDIKKHSENVAGSGNITIKDK